MHLRLSMFVATLLLSVFAAFHFARPILAMNDIPTVSGPVSLTLTPRVDWIGSGVGTGALWSSAANWSRESDSSHVVPAATDIAVFNSTTNTASSIDSAFFGSVSGIEIDSGYASTITDMLGTLDVGAGGFHQGGGQFTLGSHTLHNTGDLSLSGGTLDATSGSISQAGNWNIAGGTFTSTGSTVTFNGSTSQTIGGFGNNTFNNLTINSQGVTLTTSIIVGAALTFTTGTMTIGTNTLTLNGAVGNGTGGGVIKSDITGTVKYNQSSNGQTIATGTYGNVTFSDFNKVFGAAINGVISIAGALSPGAATTAQGGADSQVSFNGPGAQSIPALNYGFLMLQNAGTKTFLAGTTGIGNSLSLSGTATADAVSNSPTINYNSSFDQNVSPLNYFNLKFSGGGTKSFSSGTTKIAGSFTIVNATGAGGSSTVEFNGSSAQVMPAGMPTYFNLTLNNPAGVTLGSDVAVNGVLALAGGDLKTGSFSLTQPNTASSSGTFDVVGNVKRTGFSTVACGSAPCANTLSFGNPNNQITIAAATTPPSDITINLVKSAPTKFATAVQRTFTITPNPANLSGLTATLRLHYLVNELGTNTPESSLNLRRFNGVGWVPYPPTTPVDTINHWVESNAVHNFSPWTFSTVQPTAANGIIRGRITTPNGTPVEGAVVRLSGMQLRKVITDANGNYHFDNVETNGFYTVTPSRANYVFNPFNRSFSQIGNKTDVEFTATSTGDNANPLGTSEYFVRQQYVDVLGREPDEGGFNYWSDRILECGSDVLCVNARRRDVAAAFFIEQEFQETGSFIYDIYSSALGRTPAFTEYSSDRQQLVGGATLDAEKTVFAQSFVERIEFMTKYQVKTTADSLVDALLQNVRSFGVDLSDERTPLINTYNGGASIAESRAAVVRTIADNAAFKQARYKPAFVLTEYFGYLRRNPDKDGYDFWLNVLNNREPGNYRGMVCGFITSAEYQHRFGSAVTRSNADCGQ